MAYEIAKLLLEHAATFLDRQEAIKNAMRLGMPLDEIERYLDWLDLIRASALTDKNGPPDAADSQ
jgi:hypothetical protein